MHPSKFQQSMGEPSSALRLGFTDIKADEREGSRGVAGLESTPSKIGIPSSPFTFRFTRKGAGAGAGADLGLSGDAQRMMEELREKAAEIKAELVAKREAEAEAEGSDARKIAKPKGKSGRFSAAHMAEFKKMDSIENHASAWRAHRNPAPPAGSLKRSPSKANLDATTPTSQLKSALKRSPSKTDLGTTPVTPRLKPSLKRSSSRANLDEYQQSPSPKKTAAPVSTTKPLLGHFSQRVTSKRLKQNVEDDASSARPVSRDATSLPRPTSSGKGFGGLTASSSSLARLMSPTKSSLSHLATQGKSTVSLVKSPTKSDLGGGLTKSATTGNLNSPTKSLFPRSRVISPNRFQRVKSILRGQRTASGNVQTAIPAPTVSQTPGPAKLEKELPPLPLTTPRRKLTKHVAFTPEITRFAAAEQNSPSPQKISNPKQKSSEEVEEVHFAGLDDVVAKARSGEVKYPDLSGFRALPEPPVQKRETSQSSVPGTFTFRSDHTIEFADAAAPAGFGAKAGQSSVRQVRRSFKPAAEMPGSFPDVKSSVSHPNKENKMPSPGKLLFAAHGMSNKKRHRATWDEEEAENASDERAAKKRKNEHVPEGDALLAPRLVASTPKSSAKKPQATPRTPGTASPTKKRGMLSISRLNMLARPKNRA